MRRGRPELRVEVAGLGTVDPFRLRLVKRPPDSGEYCVEDPNLRDRHATLEVAGLSLAGAGQALLALSMRWMDSADRSKAADPVLPVGEVRIVLRRREARLLGVLLRRHLKRLQHAPPWMRELHISLVQIDEFLRWEE